MRERKVYLLNPSYFSFHKNKSNLGIQRGWDDGHQHLGLSLIFLFSSLLSFFFFFKTTKGWLLAAMGVGCLQAAPEEKK